MKISKITIKDFRGFPGEYEFILGEPGKNLLIYGENGSGKSSLFLAIKLFLEASREKLDITQFQNIFVENGEPTVKLDIMAFDANGDRVEGSQTYEWVADSSPYGQSMIEETAKTRGCLDYKDLLATHYVHLNSGEVDLFSLLINSLISHSPNPISNKPFYEEWANINTSVSKRLTVREKEDMNRRIEIFNNGIAALLPDLCMKTNEILDFFNQTITVDLKVQTIADFITKPKQLVEPRIYLKVNYAGQPIEAHHRFLNEARLSAIALSIYFASLLMNPASRLRVIVLDDVLIGIDMSNRMPVLDLLKKRFDDWQIIILTHDRTWFDIIRFQTQEADWCYYEVYANKDSEQGYDRPVHRMLLQDGKLELLTRAKNHLSNNDERAAAVYSRAAFEYWVKSFCHKTNIPVPFTLDNTHPEINGLWEAIKKRLVEKGTLVQYQGKIADLETFRKIVLNPWSHGAGAHVVKAEVQGAIAAVEALFSMK
jgi:energy-coupling factor transporter ATP-binding protein EcfA2